MGKIFPVLRNSFSRSVDFFRIHLIFSEKLLSLENSFIYLILTSFWAFSTNFPLEHMKIQLLSHRKYFFLHFQIIWTKNRSKTHFFHKWRNIFEIQCSPLKLPINVKNYYKIMFNLHTGSK